jgi:hypothetical protein
MHPHGRLPKSLLGLVSILILTSFAPAPPEPPPDPSPIPPDQAAYLSALLQARHRAAQKQFDETWVYYKQARTDAFPVYVWSHFVLQTQFDLSEKQSDRIAALEAHLDRMKKLDELLTKVRRLGFGQAIEVKAVEYYRIEAEYWLAHARIEAQVKAAAGAAAQPHAAPPAPPAPVAAPRR